MSRLFSFFISCYLHELYAYCKEIDTKTLIKSLSIELAPTTAFKVIKNISNEMMRTCKCDLWRLDNEESSYFTLAMGVGRSWLEWLLMDIDGICNRLWFRIVWRALLRRRKSSWKLIEEYWVAVDNVLESFQD